jgi:G3E family GTPase
MNSDLFSKTPVTPSASATSAGITPPGLLLLGGFLGAGKTSLLREYSVWLAQQGLSVGIVANDQGGGLVDAARFGAMGGNGSENQALVEEVTGGCFCCKLDELVQRLGTLVEGNRPDVIFAEPVGSCTDLVATVLRPLAEVYGMELSLGAYAVLVDGLRLADQRAFSPEVDYIYQKQMEEAEILVVNKVDLLSD